MVLKSASVLQAVPVKIQSPLGILREPSRIGQIFKPKPTLAKNWVGLPEPLFTPEIWQTRIHSHSGTGSDQDCISPGYDPSGSLYLLIHCSGAIDITITEPRLCDLSELCGVVDNFAIGQRLLKLVDFGPGEVGIIVYYKPFQAL